MNVNGSQTTCLYDPGDQVSCVPKQNFRALGLKLDDSRRNLEAGTVEGNISLPPTRPVLVQYPGAKKAKETTFFVCSRGDVPVIGSEVITELGIDFLPSLGKIRAAGAPDQTYLLLTDVAESTPLEETAPGDALNSYSYDAEQTLQKRVDEALETSKATKTVNASLRDTLLEYRDVWESPASGRCSLCEIDFAPLGDPVKVKPRMLPQKATEELMSQIRKVIKDGIFARDLMRHSGSVKHSRFSKRTKTGE
eukprot:GHVP01028896.1.p1 GENE.GHVP01028896.1~~GHVP01028896.1.p1  ORF type:complete len:251 (-),score=34.93 GHVP01028896.1:82-834(-)